MYTSTVGRTFLQEYNRRNNTSYSAKDFFDKVLFRHFFDDKKYLMWAQNAPFVQGISKKKPYFEVEERQEKLVQFHEKIERGERDASIALGFPASETKEFATTSGLVSDIPIPIDEEEVYFSWIGGTLSLGVAGGYALLFNDPNITYATFEGWKVYRKYLNDPTLDRLRPNQIITWNGQWLTLQYGKRFRKDFDFNFFVQKKAIERSETKMEIKTVEWSRLFFSLSRKLPNATQLAYVFALGQTNKTIGFIPFQLKSGRNIGRLYQQLFGEEDYQINHDALEALLGKHIKRACELGSIGIQALEPKGLAKYFQDGTKLKLSKPKFTPKKGETEEDFASRKRIGQEKDNKQIITFQTYKTWLIAMISKNKEDLLIYIKELGLALVAYRAGATKRDRATLIEKKLFGEKSKTKFLEHLIEIVQDADVEQDIIDKIKELRDRIYLMNREDFLYFWLLLKFEYAYQERNSK